MSQSQAGSEWNIHVPASNLAVFTETQDVRKTGNVNVNSNEKQQFFFLLLCTLKITTSVSAFKIAHINVTGLKQIRMNN